MTRSLSALCLVLICAAGCKGQVAKDNDSKTGELPAPKKAEVEGQSGDKLENPHALKAAPPKVDRPLDGPPTFETVALEKLRVTIRVQSHWEKRLTADYASFILPREKASGGDFMRRMDVMRLPSGPKSLAEATRGCATVAAKSDLPGGRFFYVCDNKAGQRCAGFK